MIVKVSEQYCPTVGLVARGFVLVLHASRDLTAESLNFTYYLLMFTHTFSHSDYSILLADWL